MAKATTAAVKTDQGERPQYRRVKAVTLPTLSMKENETRFLRFDAAIYVGKSVKEEKPKKDGVVDTSGKAKKEPPHLAEVTDLDTGEKATLIVNAVLKSTLEDMYPAKKEGEAPGYVGRAFELIKLPKKAGKEYHAFTVYEVDAPQ